MTEQAPLLAEFDDWTLRVYRAFWDCIKQFWNQPKWIRVTDDEMAPRFVGLNVQGPVMDPQTGQPQVDPMTGQPVMAMQNSPAEMDVDIVIDSTPDTAVIQEEQFQRLAELVQAGMPIPPDVLIEASSLPKKKMLLDKLKQAQEQQAQQPNPLAIEEKKAELQLMTKQRMAEMDEQVHARQLQRQDEADQRSAMRQEALEALKLQAKERQAQMDLAIDVRKKQTDMEHEHRRNQMSLEHVNASKQLEMDYNQASAEKQAKGMGESIGKAILESNSNTAEAMSQAADAMAQAANAIVQAAGGIVQVAQTVSAPRRLVKDPKTGEKRVEIITPKVN